MNAVTRSFILPLILGATSLGAAEVKLVKSDAGWKLTVDGKPHYVKGFTWSYTPVGMKYDYDLFAEDDSVVRAVLKRDMELMQTAGTNTLRHIVPRKWMDHIHDTYGMYFIANDYCGRYGLDVDGTFVEKTNYADPRTREIIKQKWRELATEYKDAPGLLAHALGNENNYGLEWKSAEAENLPAGERQTAKARHLYSLFNEVALELKKIDPDHPVGIVNGDLQYLDLIAELCPDIDYIAINAYRGQTYSDLFERVAKTLDKPVLLMETGCDAYNAAENREDQLPQARMVHDNWIDLYRNTLANGGSGNCLGGLVFQWADEWWKRGQQVDLNIHNPEGSWHHPAYKHDAAASLNMNEEWFGVCAIRREAIDGAHLIRPRAAYFALRDLWKQDPYTMAAADLAGLKLNEAGVMREAKAAGQALEALLPKAEVPYQTPKKLSLPAVVYREGGEALNWFSSGVMPEVNFISLDPNCTIKPHSGKTCLRIAYQSGGDWSGVQWQHPSQDWQNNSPGGYDISGATTLKLWARGEKGGEKLSLSMGGPLTGLYPNTTAAELGELTLTTEWQEFSFPLEGKDLRRIKNPLTVVLKGNGFPFKIYLDDVQFQ